MKKVGIAISAASVATAGAKFLGDSVEQAVAFESTMADVAKVVDGLRDENGRLTESYYEISDALLDMSTKIPMTAGELGEIMAAAGQAGIAEEDLISFTETAAKMGIAFDTTAEQAGEWMANWRTSFGMTQAEVVALSDKINYLGNTTSENALKLSGVVTRVGALGKTAGVSADEIAAMAASMTGVTEEISATGIKNLMLTMTAGAAVTETQAGVLEKLGYSATELAERMQVDAQGAILDLLGSIKQLPKAEQSAMLTQYFGKESVAAIAPLLSNLDFLEEQFRKIGDASLYAGSMEDEFATRSDTAENKIQLAQQSIQKLQIQLGEKLLPIIGKAADAIGKGIDKLEDFYAVIQPAMPIIMAFAGSLGSLLAAYKAVNTVVSQGIAITSGFGKAIGFLTSPVGIAIAAIAGLVAAGVYLYQNWDAVKEKAQALKEAMSAAFGAIRDFIVSAFKSAGEAASSFFAGVDEKISNMPILGSVYGGVKKVGSFLMKHPTPNSSVPALASGGVVTAPTLSLIGEGAEAEAVLPLSKLETMLGGISSGSGGQIVFAPNIEIKGNANREEVKEAMQLSFSEFKSMMARYERERRRTAF